MPEPSYNVGRIDATVGFDFDDRDAKAFTREYERLKRLRDVEKDIRVDYDDRGIRRFEDDMRRARASRSAVAKVTVDVDSRELRNLERALGDVEREGRRAEAATEGAGRGIDRLGTAAGGAGRDLGRFNLNLGILSGRAGNLLRLTAILSPALTAFGGVLVALAGSATEAAAGLGAVGIAGIGAATAGLPLLIGVVSRFTKVLDANKAAEAARQAVAIQGAQASGAQAAALEEAHNRAVQLRDAREQLTTAERDYARAVDDARDRIREAARAEADALATVEDAQRDVTAARQDALQAAQEANREARRSTTDVKQADLDLRGAHDEVGDARARVNRLVAEGKAGTEEHSDALRALEQAELNVTKAEDGLTDAKRRATDAEKQRTKFEKDGLRAHEPLQRALKARADAGRDYADALAESNRLRRDGIRDDEQLIAAAERVRDARQALDEARRPGATAGGGVDPAAVAKAALLTDELTDSERRLLKAIQDISKEFNERLQPATDEVFDGLADGITTVEPLLGRFEGRFHTLGKAVGDEIRAITADLASPEWTERLDELLAGTDDVVREGGRGLRELLAILRDIAVAGLPSLVDLLKDTADWLERIGDKTKDTDRLRDSVGDLYDQFRSWLSLLRATGGLLITILRGGADEGRGLVDSLTGAIDAKNEFFKTAEGQRELSNFFKTSVERLKDIARFIRGFATGVKDTLGFLSPLANKAADFVGWILRLNGDGSDGIERIGKVLGVIATLKFLGITKLLGNLLSLGGKGGAIAAVLDKIPGLNKLRGPSGGTVGDALRERGSSIARPLYVWVVNDLPGSGPVTGPGGRGRGRPSTGSRPRSRLGRIRDRVGRIGRSPITRGAGGAAATVAGSQIGGPAGGALAGGGIGYTVGGPPGAAIGGFIGLLAGGRGRPGTPRGELEELNRINAQGAAASKVLGQLDKTIETFRRKLGRQGIREELSPTLQNMRKKAGELRSELALDFTAKWIQNLRRGKGATEETVGAMIRDLEKLPPSARKEAAELAIGMAKRLEEKGKLPKGTAKDLRDAVVDRFSEMKVRSVRESRRLGDGIAGNFGGLQTVVATAMSFIGAVTNDSLKAWGVKQVKLAVRKPRDLGKLVGSVAGLAGSLFGERGGFIGAARGFVGRAGERGRDRVHAVLGRGEAVLNGFQQRVVNMGLRAIGMRGGLPELFRRERRVHSAAPAAYEQGGYVQGAQAPTGPNSGPIRALLRELFGRGFNATSGGEYRGTGTGHDQQQAADFGNSANDLRALWRVLFPRRRRINELYGPSAYAGLYEQGRKFENPKLQADHEDHIHVRVLQAVGALATRALGRLRVTGEGAAADLADATIDRVRRAANRYVQDNSAPEPGAHGPGQVTGGPGGGGAGANMRIARGMLDDFGWGDDQWPALRALGQGESGWNEKARNPISGAFGIGQFLGATLDAYRVHGAASTDPRQQIYAMLTYIKDRYGSPRAAYRFWLSQSPHYYARGGLAFDSEGPIGPVNYDGPADDETARDTERGTRTRRSRRDKRRFNPKGGIDVPELRSWTRAVWDRMTRIIGRTHRFPNLQFVRTGPRALHFKVPGKPDITGAGFYFDDRNLIQISRGSVEDLADPDSDGHAYSLGTVLHELAHARQRRDLDGAEEIEGGAEAFNQSYLTSILRMLGFDDPERPVTAPGYERYVRSVRKSRGPAWIRSGQFRERGGYAGAEPTDGADSVLSGPLARAIRNIDNPPKRKKKRKPPPPPKKNRRARGRRFPGPGDKGGQYPTTPTTPAEGSPFYQDPGVQDQTTDRELTRLERELIRAQRTKDRNDDYVALKALEAYWRGRWGHALNQGDEDAAFDAEQGVYSVLDQLAALDEAAQAEKDAEKEALAQAQLAQSQTRIANLTANLQSAEANVAALGSPGDIGAGLGGTAYAAAAAAYGPGVGPAAAFGAAGGPFGQPPQRNVNLVLQSFVPATGRDMARIARTTARALDGQGYVPSHTDFLP
jgi:hypothetical protein